MPWLYTHLQIGLGNKQHQKLHMGGRINKTDTSKRMEARTGPVPAQGWR